MAQSKWEADKMLDVYIYDYLMKRNLQATAKAFLSEGNVATDPVAIDAPGGFLFEWWSVFWDIFIARTNPKHSDVAAAFIETQQMKAREQQQQQQMQQLQLMQRQQQQQQQQQQIQQHHQQQTQQRDPGHPSAAFNGAMSTMNSDPVLGSSAATVLAAKLIEERMKNPNGMGAEPSNQMIDRMAMLKSAAAANNRPGQMVQGNSMNISALQQMQARNQQPDMKGDLGVLQRSLPVDPASIYGQGIMQAKTGLSNVGLNQGVSGLPLKGWPLTGIPGMEQLRPNLGMQKQYITSQNQVQLISPRQQQFFAQTQAQAQAQAQAQGMANSAEMGPQGFRALPGGGFTGKDAQPNGTDGSIGSPVQSSSSKMNVAQMQQSSTQQTQEMQQQHQQMQQQQNNRKRKPTSSGPANSTGTGNHAGPSPPSTPSTHTPGDAGQLAGTAGAGNLQQQQQQMGGVMQKSTIMYGSDAMGGFASSSNQMDILDHCGDIGFFDDNVDSFLSNDDADPREIFAGLKRSPADNSDSFKGFAFSEAACDPTPNGKVVCCHFSSDGKILASAGHDKKVSLWNTDTLQTEHRGEEHVNLITDIRFRVNSPQLATSSFDGTVRLWNAAERGGCVQTFLGHTSQVTSLDFHPKRTELLSSCDDNGEIRFWLVGQQAPSRVSRGGSSKVRFQPRVGRLLAAAAESVVNIIDIEADMQIRPLKGHNNDVSNICWDENGDYLASVSQDAVKVWSMGSMECVHAFSSNGNKFHSCVFHPRYPKILIIGCYQSLELWSITDSQRIMTLQAHDGLISALAQSPVTGAVASASHDRTVKLWK